MALPRIPVTNDPENFDTSFNDLPIDRRFSKLPTTGQMDEHVPYTDDYWPYKNGGINLRWNKSGSIEDRAFKYDPPSYKTVKNMSLDQLKELSPAEKYDLVRGDYRYGTYKEQRRVAGPDAESWEGICNGWAASAINHSEPQDVVVTNPDGLQIPFGSSDVKALLAYAYDSTFKFKFANIFRKRPDTDRAFIGELCRTDVAEAGVDAESIAACADVNAGAFHIILGNQMGLQRRGFLIDYDKGHEIWNQPAFGYISKEVSRTDSPTRGAAPGTVTEIVMQTDLFFTAERSPEYTPTVGTDRFGFNVAKYQYRLELNANGEIIGGAWEKRHSPDMDWMATVNRGMLQNAGLSALIPLTLSQMWTFFDRPDDLWLNSPIQFVGRFSELGNKVYKGIDSSKIKMNLQQDSIEFIKDNQSTIALGRYEAARQQILRLKPEALR